MIGPEVRRQLGVKSLRALFVLHEEFGLTLSVLSGCGADPEVLEPLFLNHLQMGQELERRAEALETAEGGGCVADAEEYVEEGGYGGSW